jgi:hypothetical protein
MADGSAALMDPKYQANDGGLQLGDSTVGSTPALTEYDVGSQGMKNTTDTAASSAPASSSASTSSGLGSTLSSFFGDLGGSALSSLLGSNGSNSLGTDLGTAIGTSIPYAAQYSAASSAANAQKEANKQTLSPLTNEATTLLDSAHTQLNQFNQGSLTGSQQAQMDAYVQQQKQQVAQRLSSNGIVDSTALDTAYQQIDNNALIMRQQFVQQALTNALNLESTALGPLTTAISDTLNSDTQISNSMTQLMGTLAQAWAYQMAGGSNGSGTNGTGTSGTNGNSSGLNSTASKALNTALQKALGNGGSAGVTGTQGALDGLTADNAFNMDAVANSASIATDVGTGAADAFGAASDSAIGSQLGDFSGFDASTFSGGSEAAGATGLTELPEVTITAAAPEALSGTALANSIGSDAAASSLDAYSSSLGSTEAGAGGSSLGAWAGYAAMAGIAAEALGQAFGGHNASITNVSDGQTVTKLPSGMYALQQGNLAMGAGTDRSQGSGEFFLMKPDGSVQWLGQDATSSMGTYSQLAAVPKGTAPSRGHAGYDMAQNGMQQMRPMMQQIYDQNGGQQAWGVDFDTWLTQVAQVNGNVGGSL